MRPRTRNINVYLIKDGLKVGDALKETDGLASYRMRRGSGVVGEFFLKPPSRRQVRWYRDVAEIVDALPTPETESAAGCLFVEAAGRLFALTFGHGWSMLEPGSFEVGFGLRVTLNAVDPSSLRSVDVRTMEELTLQTRTQASRASDIGTFALDDHRDLLRAVTGTPRDADFGKRVSGADSLVLATTRPMSEVPALLERALALFGDTFYKQEFPWVDQMARVKERSRIVSLDDLVVDALRTGDTEHMHFAPPEPVNWDDIGGFRFPREPADAESHDEFDIDDYRNSFDDLDDLTIEILKSDRVIVDSNEAGRSFPRWSVYRSLVFEMQDRGATFVLTGGEWYRIESAFAEDVTQRLRTVEVATLALPPAPKRQKEADYNAAAAQALPGAVLMDKRFVPVRGTRTKLELCDILTPEGDFVHVKRKNESATLSHLFAQGVVSAQTFLGDAEFRGQARALLPPGVPKAAELLPDGQPARERYRVVYAVIGKDDGNWPEALPFFSKLSLLQASDALRPLGLRVATQRVPWVA